MSAAQAAFLAALSLVVLGVALLSGVVVVSSLRRTGSARLSRSMRRLELSSGSAAADMRWASYLHRVSGLAILLFLCLHMIDVSLFAFSSSLYDRVHVLYADPVLRVLECGLVFAVVFHTLNGLRIMLVDGLDLGLDPSRRALRATFALTAAAGLAASVVILAPVA